MNLSDESWPRIDLIGSDIGPDYRALVFVSTTPLRGRAWLWWIWGSDVWYAFGRFQFPLVKSLVAANVLVWLVLFL